MNTDYIHIVPNLFLSIVSSKSFNVRYGLRFEAYKNIEIVAKLLSVV